MMKKGEEARRSDPLAQSFTVDGTVVSLPQLIYTLGKRHKEKQKIKFMG